MGELVLTGIFIVFKYESLKSMNEFLDHLFLLFPWLNDKSFWK